MSAGLMNTSRKPFSPRACGELGAFVGDGDEVIRPAADGGTFQLLPEMRSQRVRLDGRARLAGEHVERPVGQRGHGADRRGIGRIDHPEARPARRHAENRPQDFGRETRSAHAEQDHVVDLAAPDAAGKVLELADCIGHAARVR